MPENCPHCGEEVASDRASHIRWWCDSWSVDGVVVQQSPRCRVVELEARLAALLAELAEVEREDMLPDGTGIDGSVSDWLEGIVEQRPSSLDSTYSALREDLAAANVILALLPQTKDGKRVVPGESTAWHPDVRDIDGNLAPMSVLDNGGAWWSRTMERYLIGDCYSTTEAAKAAGGDDDTE